MKRIPFILFAVGISAIAAEPRFQLRSFIQADGSLMHVRLDTQTGKTWRLERSLKNRVWASPRGKETEKKLEALKLDAVAPLFDFTLEESMEVLEVIMQKSNGGKKAVPLMFLVPAADPALKRKNAGGRIVPPALPRNPRPLEGIDPATGLPIQPLPGIRPQPVDPTTGPPLPPQPRPRPPFGPGPGGVPIDPTTGLPVGPGLPGLPGLPPRGFVPRENFNRVGPPDAAAIRVRGMKKRLEGQSALDMISLLLNMVDTPLRCVIDENLVYVIPEGSTVTIKGGKFARPEYEENWVLVGEKKAE